MNSNSAGKFTDRYKWHGENTVIRSAIVPCVFSHLKKKKKAMFFNLNTFFRIKSHGTTKNNSNQLDFFFWEKNKGFVRAIMRTEIPDLTNSTSFTIVFFIPKNKYRVLYNSDITQSHVGLDFSFFSLDNKILYVKTAFWVYLYSLWLLFYLLRRFDTFKCDKHI